MADTTPVGGNVKDLLAAAQERSKSRSVKRELDKDAFLQLLVAQLKHQDPMKPMDDTGFIAQMAQFSSLEQMQNLNKTMESQKQFGALSAASALIGKKVSLKAPGDGTETVTGTVDEVRSSDGKIALVVGGKPYDAAWVVQVADAQLADARSESKEG